MGCFLASLVGQNALSYTAFCLTGLSLQQITPQALEILPGQRGGLGRKTQGLQGIYTPSSPQTYTRSVGVFGAPAKLAFFLGMGSLPSALQGALC